MISAPSAGVSLLLAAPKWVRDAAVPGLFVATFAALRALGVPDDRLFDYAWLVGGIVFALSLVAFTVRIALAPGLQTTLFGGGLLCFVVAFLYYWRRTADG
jgi:hypothetical protein